MKVLLINGSAREHGCTNRALEEIAAALSDDGIESEIIWPGVEVRGCMACGYCKKNGCCVLNDIVNKTAEKLRSCDGMVVGTPVYYASPNGSIISFMDRLFHSAAKSLRYKPGAVIASARRAGTTASLDVLQKYFSINQMPVISSSYWNMVHGNAPEEVDQDLEGLRTMRNLAHNMAWMLKCIDAGKKNGIPMPNSESGDHTNFIR